jgi:hypothetical protein
VSNGDENQRVIVRLFPSRPSRLTLASCISGFAVLGVWQLLRLGGEGVLLAAVCGLGVAWGVRAMQMGVDATPSGLVVRSQYKTRLLPWRDIEGFRTGVRGSDSRGVFAAVAAAGVVKLPVGTFRGVDEQVRNALEDYRTRAGIPEK